MSLDCLHIALGDTASGALKEACRRLGLPGVAFAIPDDLSNGPLHDGRARAAYFREPIGEYPAPEGWRRRAIKANCERFKFEGPRTAHNKSLVPLLSSLLLNC